MLLNQRESYCFSVFGKIRCLNADVEKLGCKTEKTLVSGSGSEDHEIIAGSATTDASVDGELNIPPSSDDAVKEVTAASPSGIPGSQDKEDGNSTEQQCPRERKNTDVVASEETSSHELQTADELPSEESSFQEKQAVNEEPSGVSGFQARKISGESSSKQFGEASMKLTTE